MLTANEKLARKEKSLELLKTLGSSADEIANSLQSMGIKGRRFRCSECPLGIFLSRHGVSLYDIDLWPTNNSWPSYPIKAINDFILAFDKLEYRGLIDTDYHHY